MAKYNVGQKIYNNGDMANPEEFGVIVEVIEPDDVLRYTRYKIKSDSGRTYTVSESAFSDVYKGHSGTRIVPFEAYKKYRDEIMQRYKDTINKTRF